MLAPFASGAEHQTLALCRYLGPSADIHFLTNDEFADLLRSDPFLRGYVGGLRVVRLGPAFPVPRASSIQGALQRVWCYSRLQMKLWRTLATIRPSLVHLILAPSFFAYGPLFHLTHWPTVVTLAGEMRYVRHFYGAAKRLATLHAVAQAKALVACSADELANLEAVAPGAGRKATVLDNFTDVARFAPTPVKEALVTFAARLHPEKGALLFLSAAAGVHRQQPAARFALMGRGEQEQEVAGRIAQLGLGGVVTRGFATDLAPLYARSSIFVSCQQLENLGSSSLLEAMASGNAIVATAVGSTAQIVDETVGLLVRPEEEALGEAIAALLADPARCAVLGAAARQRVLDRYAPKAYVARLLAIYEQVGLVPAKTLVPARRR